MRVLFVALAFVGVVPAALAVERVAFPVGRSIVLTREPVLACRSARPLRSYLTFSGQGDREAAKKQLTVSMGSGECATLAKGDEVFVVRSYEDDSVLVVRRRGEIGERYVIIQTLMTDAEIVAWDAARNGDRQVSRLARVCAAMKETPLCTAFYYDGPKSGAR